MEVDELQEVLMVSNDSLSNPSMITESSPPSTFCNLLIDAPDALPIPPTPPLLTQSGHPRHDYRLPKQFQDNLPEPPAPVPNLPSNPNSETHPVRWVILIVRDCLVTVMNSFGIWQNYLERPSVDPDALLTIEDLSNSNRYGNTFTSGTHTSESSPPHWPFLNATVHAVM